MQDCRTGRASIPDRGHGKLGSKYCEHPGLRGAPMNTPSKKLYWIAVRGGAVPHWPIPATVDQMRNAAVHVGERSSKKPSFGAAPRNETSALRWPATRSPRCRAADLPPRCDDGTNQAARHIHCRRRRCARLDPPAHRSAARSGTVGAAGRRVVTLLYFPRRSIVGNEKWPGRRSSTRPPEIVLATARSRRDPTAATGGSQGDR